MTTILVIACVALAGLGASLWMRLREEQGARNIRAGVADTFTDELCADHRRRLTGVQL
jgi:hypothetical protein